MNSVQLQGIQMNEDQAFEISDDGELLQEIEELEHFRGETADADVSGWLTPPTDSTLAAPKHWGGPATEALTPSEKASGVYNKEKKDADGKTIKWNDKKNQEKFIKGVKEERAENVTVGGVTVTDENVTGEKVKTLPVPVDINTQSKIPAKWESDQGKHAAIHTIKASSENVATGKAVVETKADVKDVAKAAADAGVF
jgi:hypothetical protein